MFRVQNSRRPFLLAAVALAAAAAAAERPAKWAVPIKKDGLPNLHRVSPTLYRGAQPTAAGMRELEKMGVKTVVCLRAHHSDKDELAGTKLACEEIPINTWNIKTEQVARFLRIAADKDRAPVFVHCQHGADRTGTMCAVYRIAVEGWSKEEAVREMTEGGFNFHSVWTNLINFIKELDVESVRREAGLSYTNNNPK